MQSSPQIRKTRCNSQPQEDQSCSVQSLQQHSPSPPKEQQSNAAWPFSTLATPSQSSHRHTPIFSNWVSKTTLWSSPNSLPHPLISTTLTMPHLLYSHPTLIPGSTIRSSSIPSLELTLKLHIHGTKLCLFTMLCLIMEFCLTNSRTHLYSRPVLASGT